MPLITVKASDRDSGSNAKVIYSITGGNTDNKFNIDSDKGTSYMLPNSEITCCVRKGQLILEINKLVAVFYLKNHKNKQCFLLRVVTIFSLFRGDFTN